MKKEAAEQLASGKEELVLLAGEEPSEPKYIALKAAFTGFEMGVNPVKALFLAREARDLTNRAYENGENCFLCLSVRANQLRFTPTLFGGSVKSAIPLYISLIEYFEEQKI
ncbi:MAG: hypothetical protein R2727_03810 [Bacteroidales bacterium]